MSCLYLEIEGQSCLVGSVDQGLMKIKLIDLLDRRIQKRAKEKTFSSCFPHSDVTRSLSAITSKNFSKLFGLTISFLFS